MATAHRAFDVHEPSQVGEVRRAAALIAADQGFGDVAAGRVALVVTELGTNLVKHARRGRLLLAPVNGADGEPMVEVMSLDDGPGMDVGRAMADGFSTSGTAGQGLGAVRRLARDFDLYSRDDEGTVIVARIPARAGQGAAPASAPATVRADVGAIAVCAPGETVCGDGWALAQAGHQLALMMADGLGHGPVANEAAQAAERAFHRGPFESPAVQVERMHQALRSTRGAAVAVAVADLDSRRFAYAGAGNISGRILSGTEDRSLMSHHGTAGLAVRRMQDQHYEWPPHAVLVMHSDGLSARWDLAHDRGLLQHHPSVVAAWLLRSHSRGRDDATVVVLQLRGG